MIHISELHAQVGPIVLPIINNNRIGVRNLFRGAVVCKKQNAPDWGLHLPYLRTHFIRSRPHYSHIHFLMNNFIRNVYLEHKIVFK